ncbi:MAG TPA: hypothetical protein VF517_16320 [Thermoleophilaceae bacterium]|jgi:hypothetical protein
MTRKALVAALAVTATMLLAPAAQAKHRSASCYPHGSRTVTANNFVRVYGVPPTDPDAQGSRRLVACSLTSGRRKALGGYEACQFAGQYLFNIRLTGRMVGYVSAECLGFSSSVYVRDMTTGRVLWIAETAPGRGHTVTDLEVARNGSAAWIAAWKNAEYERDYEGRVLRTVEVSGDRQPVTRDDSLDIKPGSLALGRTDGSGATPFYWSKGGQVFSATLR